MTQQSKMVSSYTEFSLENPYNIDWNSREQNIKLGILITHNFGLSPIKNKSKLKTKYKKQHIDTYNRCNSTEAIVNNVDWSYIERNIIENGIDESRLIKNPPQQLVYISSSKWWKLYDKSNGFNDLEANLDDISIKSQKIENFIGVRRLYAIMKDIDLIRDGYYLCEVVDKTKLSWVKIKHNI